MLELYAQLHRVVGEGLAHLDRGGGAEAARPARRRCGSTRASRRCSTIAACAASSTTSSTCSTCRAATCTAAPPTSTMRSCRACARSTRRSRSSSTTSTSTSTSTSRAVGRASDTGEMSPSIWYFAQMGLVEVAYQLRRVNHHLKVFAAVRKEAFLKLRRDDVDGAAVPRQRHRHPLHRSRACARSSSTTSAARRTATSSIPELLRTNPDRRRSSARASVANAVHPRGGGRLRLHRPAHAAPAARLHDHRPEALRPAAAASAACAERFKEVVNQAANEIARRVPERDRALPRQRRPAAGVRRACRPTCSGARRSRTSSTQHNVAAGRGRTRLEHIFCMLFRAGLLGHVDIDHVTGKRVQRFLPPRRGDLPARRDPAATRRTTSSTRCCPA